MTTFRQPIASPIFLAIALVIGSNCEAADWVVTPRLSLSELYSDNIQLQPLNEQDDFVTQVTPGVSIRAQGARLDLNADYNMQSLFYLNDGSRDQTFHQLQSNLNFEAVRNRLFINAFGNVFQALVSSNGTIGNDNARISNNRDDVIAFGVRPEFKHHFGNWADFSASTQFNEVIREQDRTGAGRGNNFNARLKSGSRFDRVRWNINYSQRSNNNANGASSSTFRRVNSRIQYRLNRFFSVDGSIGIEDNDFQGRSNANNNNNGSRGHSEGHLPRVDERRYREILVNGLSVVQDHLISVTGTAGLVFPPNTTSNSGLAAKNYSNSN